MEIPRITLTDKVNIWAYVGLLLNRFGPLNEQLLIDINNETEAVSYFEFVSSFSGMKEKGLIETVVKRGESCWTMTEKGNEMLSQFENDIPASILEKTLATAKRLTERAELERSIVCRVLEEKGRYYVSIRLLNETNGEDIMTLRLNSPSKEQAEIIEKRFLSRPNEVITKFMNMLLKDDYFMY